MRSQTFDEVADIPRTEVVAAIVVGAIVLEVNLLLAHRGIWTMPDWPLWHGISTAIDSGAVPYTDVVARDNKPFGLFGILALPATWFWPIYIALATVGGGALALATAALGREWFGTISVPVLVVLMLWAGASLQLFENGFRLAATACGAWGLVWAHRQQFLAAGAIIGIGFAIWQVTAVAGLWALVVAGRDRSAWARLVGGAAAPFSLLALLFGAVWGLESMIGGLTWTFAAPLRYIGVDIALQGPEKILVGNEDRSFFIDWRGALRKFRINVLLIAPVVLGLFPMLEDDTRVWALAGIAIIPLAVRTYPTYFMWPLVIALPLATKGWERVSVEIQDFASRDTGVRG